MEGGGTGSTPSVVAESRLGEGRAGGRKGTTAHPGPPTLGCQGTEASSLRCSTSSCKLQAFFHVTSAFVFYGRSPEERLSQSPAARRISPPPTRRPQHPGLAGAHVPCVCWN